MDIALKTNMLLNIDIIIDIFFSIFMRLVIDIINDIVDRFVIDFDYRDIRNNRYFNLRNMFGLYWLV